MATSIAVEDINSTDAKCERSSLGWKTQEEKFEEKFDRFVFEFSEIDGSLCRLSLGNGLQTELKQ